MGKWFVTSDKRMKYLSLSASLAPSRNRTRHALTSACVDLGVVAKTFRAGFEKDVVSTSAIAILVGCLYLAKGAVNHSWD